MHSNGSAVIPAWKRVLFSDFMLQRGRAQRIATVGVMTALCIVANMFLEIKFFDVQFSLRFDGDVHRPDVRLCRRIFGRFPRIRL